MESNLLTILPAERVKMRLIDRYAYASDASHFYLVPLAVVQPVSMEEIRQLFALSHDMGINMTFRAGGTSLSGQAVSDGILVDLSNYWRKVVPENDGHTVRVQPGAIGAHVNLALRPFGRKIGPDPASIQAAMMGGILSNNSSGMCCGVVNNSYHTLQYITFVLPNGHIYTTEKPEDYDRFEKEEADLASGLRQLRTNVWSNADLMERIRRKYKQKNTVGYCLNAFVDFEHPLDIMAHVIVGGEGTLAFIAEAVLHTLPDLPQKLTGMLYFDSPESACKTIPDLIRTGAEALEFMDRASLRSVESMPGVPDFLQSLPPGASAILCEYQEGSEEGLQQVFNQAKPVLDGLPLLFPPVFTSDPHEQAIMWKIRKGMYPSVAGMRAKGTSALMEDFTFPVERLGEAVVDVQQLFAKHGYENGIIFGHAKDGNLHFVISQSYATQPDIDHYEKFNEDIFHLVLAKYKGSLKGEHSSGRAVSAFIEAEWGSDAYDIMRQLKKLSDPTGLLNPGIVITEDKLTHVHNLKVMPVVEGEVDRCIECGFCENSCPSRDITLTPRRRIGVRRAMKRLEEAGDHATRKALLKDYAYEGLDTCAVDGMCATQCPVDINTGELVKRLRAENHSRFQQRVAWQLAKKFHWIEKTARLAFRTGIAINGVIGRNFMKNLTSVSKKVLAGTPLWPTSLTKSDTAFSEKLLRSQGHPVADSPSVVYFTSCISRMMGNESIASFLSVCKKANVQLHFPSQTMGTCCGQVFSSKGYTEAYGFTANQIIERLYADTGEGCLPVVTDVTSCTQTIMGSRPYLTEENKLRFDRMTFVDVIEFAASTLVPRLQISRPKKNVVFHPVCSAHKMGLVAQLQAVGNACAEKAEIPVFSGCCGMAGDRGFYFPELTKSATHKEASEVRQKEYDGYYSTSRTCEMALSDAVGKNYESLMVLLDEVSGGLPD
ncbi:MAG: FAD-binding oxidoreductase [Cyclobacteriaceae bacterium]|nr:FAD-binding oxidoreductase [Cyclobacteriaceae bacterium]